MPEAITLKYIFLALILIAVIIEVFADILFKKWSVNNNNILLYLGLVAYLIGTIFWAFSLKYEFLAKAGSTFTILNMILITLAGLFIFKEDLSSINKIGIVLGALSIILIEI